MATVIPLILPALLASPGAHADTVRGGLQAAVFGGGLEFVEDQLAGFTLDLAEDQVGGEVGCYDALIVEDFNVHLPIDTVSLELGQGQLDITVRFDQIYAEDFEIHGEDGDYFDACIEFDADVDYVELEDAVLELSLSADVEDGQLALSVVGTPSLSGDLDSDIAWFPDDLALAYFEDTIFETISSQLGDALPGLVSEYLGDALFGTAYGEWSVEVGLDDAQASSTALTLKASPSIAWTGTDGCPTADRDEGSPGSNPSLSFGSGDGSDLALGVTEGTVNELFLAAWRDGYFCFTEANVDDFLGLIASAFEPEVAGLLGTASLLEAPLITIDTEGLHFELGDIGAAVSGEIDGQREQLLEIRGDVSGTLELGLDQGLSSFTLSLHALELDIDRLEADHLVAEGSNGEAELRRFLEDWVGGWIADLAQDMVVFSSLYHAFDIAIRVDELHTDDGGLRVYFSLYEADDPQVDTIPPETEFAMVAATEEFVELAMWGSDDRLGPLAYAVQIDSGGWSAWSTDGLVRLTGLGEGISQIEVVARDSWLNVDPTPAIAWYEPGQLTESEKACACASARGSMLSWALLPLVGGLVLRRRRR